MKNLNMVEKDGKFEFDKSPEIRKAENPLEKLSAQISVLGKMIKDNYENNNDPFNPAGRDIEYDLKKLGDK